MYKVPVLSKKRKNNEFLVVVSFLALPLAFLVLLLLYPTAELIRYSFSSWNGLTPDMQFAGLDNFARALGDSKTWVALSNNALYFFGHLLTFPFCILLASLINEKLRGSGFFRSMIFLPYVLNAVAVAFTFQQFFDPYFGSLNYILGLFGVTNPPDWLGDPNVVNYSLVGVSIWRWTGFNTILFLAGLQAIPQEQYEAAKIDGASWWQQIWAINIPGIALVLELVLFLNARGALQLFDTPFLMTNGGPAHASATFTLLSLETAFKFQDFGLASALAMILIAFIVLLNFIQRFAGRGLGNYKD